MSEPGAVASRYCGCSFSRTATIFASSPVACAWIGGIAALVARSTALPRKAWITSGPALTSGQSDTVNGRSASWSVASS